MMDTEEQIESAKEDYIEGKIDEREFEKRVEIAFDEHRFHSEDFLCSVYVLPKDDGWLYMGDKYVNENGWMVRV